MNSQSRHDAPSVTPALKISLGFGALSIKVFESNFQFWSSPLSIPNYTQQFLWTLQFNVALPDLVNFMSIASSYETQSPPREGLGAAAKNNSSAVKYAIKRYFFSETQLCCSARLDHRKKNTALSWLDWYLRGLEKDKRPSTRHNCSEKGLLLFHDNLV